MLKDNIIEIEKRIQAACDRAGRDRSEVTLIAVSKTKPVSMIREAYECGMRHFGENKVQELSQKYEELKDSFGEDIYWHQIGHLQRNKVKNVIDKAVLIHSVDSLRLALQIEQEAAKKNLLCDILIEVNVSGEDTKYGVSVEETLPLIQAVVKLAHIRIRGLMTIAPNSENPEKNRECFKKLRELYVDIKTKNIDNEDNEKIWDKSANGSPTKENLECNFSSYFNILSMGMTGDFEVAIEEGATMVRVGTGIFGERQYDQSN
ncbi:MAG TPA: YggS family pyridoxal phosphate-dependent enzyme [Lachnospiraceae bacterium]|nr:YggS family pyridoxal phosphate-dependent enzyme [Lachnospiraceae bacterium]HCM12223.1 YggS family pyridoxal phosphate-dependent enzyme [Lachnospiraceae bacterium]HCR40295.1 YggS family pyridoxal phosphate-dependent enzyme [Lachnospiraceae bacterium]